VGLERLRNLDPKPPVQRYEREIPDDIIHIDIKKLARFRQVGDRITGSRLPEPGCGLVQRPGRGMASGDERQRLGLHLQSICQSLQLPWPQANPHKASHAPQQRQGRALYQDTLAGVGLLDALPEL